MQKGYTAAYANPVSAWLLADRPAAWRDGYISFCRLIGSCYRRVPRWNIQSDILLLFTETLATKLFLGSKFEAFTMSLDSYYMLEMHYKFPVNGKYMPALVAQGLERSIADRQVPRSNRGQSSFFCQPHIHPCISICPGRSPPLPPHPQRKPTLSASRELTDTQNP